MTVTAVRISRLLPRGRTAAAALWLALVAPLAAAQADPARFPAAAAGFLDAELPAMNAAVAAKDRGYFEQGMARMVAFSEQWGFKTHINPALADYGACTRAVSDYLVVGLCQLTPGTSECTSELNNGFARDLAACRARAGR